MSEKETRMVGDQRGTCLCVKYQFIRNIGKSWCNPHACEINSNLKETGFLRRNENTCMTCARTQGVCVVHDEQRYNEQQSWLDHVSNNLTTVSSVFNMRKWPTSQLLMWWRGDHFILLWSTISVYAICLRGIPIFVSFFRLFLKYFVSHFLSAANPKNVTEAPLFEGAKIWRSWHHNRYCPNRWLVGCRHFTKEKRMKTSGKETAFPLNSFSFHVLTVCRRLLKQFYWFMESSEAHRERRANKRERDSLEKDLEESQRKIDSPKRCLEEAENEKE